MMTAEERRIDFYGAGDSRAYDHDEIYLMKEYAKDYHESEVKKFRLGAVVGRSEQLLAFKTWEAEKCKLPWDASPEQIIKQYLSQ